MYVCMYVYMYVDVCVRVDLFGVLRRRALSTTQTLNDDDACTPPYIGAGGQGRGGAGRGGDAGQGAGGGSAGAQDQERGRVGGLCVFRCVFGVEWSGSAAGVKTHQ